MAKGTLKNSIVAAVEKAVEIEVETRMVLELYTRAAEGHAARLDKVEQALKDQARDRADANEKLLAKCEAWHLTELDRAEIQHRLQVAILAALGAVNIVATIVAACWR
jgi:hypothetical protein